jgi:hypothetical protein
LLFSNTGLKAATAVMGGGLKKYGKRGAAGLLASRATKAARIAADEKAQRKEIAQAAKEAAEDAKEAAREAAEAAAEKKAQFLKKVAKRRLPEAEEDRLQAALQLRTEAAAAGVNIFKSDLRLMFSIGEKKLNNAIANVAQGGDGVVDRGRPTRMSDEQAREVHEILDHRARFVRCVLVDDGGKGDSFKDICMQVIQKSAPNNYCAVKEPAPATLKMWQEQCEGIERAAKRRNDGRVRALLDLRSGLSFAAALAVIFSVCHYMQFFSTDDVSVMCYGWGQNKNPKVMTTKEAIAYGNEHNLSPGFSGSSGETSKQRVMVYNTTISTAYKLTCTVLKLADNSFTDEVISQSSSLL